MRKISNQREAWEEVELSLVASVILSLSQDTKSASA
jgi:hypothetical protein